MPLVLDYSMLPEHMVGAMERYMKNGVAPGGFLEAVLSNDLLEAMERADMVNRYRLYDFGQFLHQQAPRGSFGSPDRVANWVKVGGYEGYTKEEEK